MASQRDPKSEMPFWEGASRQPRSNSQQASTGPSPANKDLTAGSRNLALPADLQPSLAGGDVDGSWWSAGAHPEDKSSSGAPAENASWNVENTASNTSLPNNSVKPNSSTVRPTNGTPPTGNDQWAYQLGMSAGPGTLFPVMANYAPASGVAMEAVSGPMGSLRGGSSDARSAAPAGNFIPVDTDQRQWQTVPIENAPRNPAENSGSSTTVPWPDNSTSQIPRGSAGRTAKSQPMPVITPGGSSAPWGTTAANTPRRNVAGGATAGNPADGVNAGVVPAWYDVPASNKSNGSRPSPANAGGEFSPSAGQ
jgi:hypothetical protein